MDTIELKLWEAYEADRSITNRNALITFYVPMAKLIGKSRRRGSRAEEFRADVLSGLIDAVEKFDRSKNVTFQNYANRRCVGNALDEELKHYGIRKVVDGKRTKISREKPISDLFDDDQDYVITVADHNAQNPAEAVEHSENFDNLIKTLSPVGDEVGRQFLLLIASGYNNTDAAIAVGKSRAWGAWKHRQLKKLVTEMGITVGGKREYRWGLKRKKDKVKKLSNI